MVKLPKIKDLRAKIVGLEDEVEKKTKEISDL